MEQLKIAICGGGIASLCLAHALCKHPQLHVTIYEASVTFRDEGAAVGLGSNAQEALRLISPDLRDALDAAGGTIMDPSARLMMGVGPESGHRVGDIRRTIPQIVVHRGPFLRALRSKVPDEALQMGKKLISIDDHGPRVRLHFEDGTVSEVDALIGCDGINSITRSTVLGADHPATRAVYTGGYLHRVVIPLDDAVSAFGQEYCNDKTQHGWVGDGGFLMTDFVDYGKAMQVIAGWWTKTWKEDSPFMEWPKEQLTADLEPWGDIGKAMTKVFTEPPVLYAAGERVHLDTPTYSNGKVCVAGDAAQSFPPFQGAGAGQAIEDALILSTVLGICTTSDDVLRALQTYNVIRHPRRSDIARSGHWAAMFLTGRDPEVGLDISRMAEKLASWGSNIYNYDLAASQQQAIDLMKEH